MNSKRRTGFTLIELLVVIAIIALLMAVLMPALTRVRKQAKAVVCQTRLKQWGLYFSMYCDGNNGFFQYGCGEYNGTTSTQKGIWLEALRRLHKNNYKVFTCPITKLTVDEDNNPTGASRPYAVVGMFPRTAGTTNPYNYDKYRAGDRTSYGINAWVANPPPECSLLGTWQLTPEKFWRTPAVRGGNVIPLLGDAQWQVQWPDAYDWPPALSGMMDGGDNFMDRFSLDRHEGGINMLFLDYSVRKVGIKELWTLNWHRGYAKDAPTPEWTPWMRNFRDFAAGGGRGGMR